MGYDLLISVLDGSNWAFLSLCMLLLGVAFIATFPEASPKPAAKVGLSANRSRTL